MLEKLGDALKRAIDKVANAVFLDKSMVDALVKDLQRALIEADVHVPLVAELSKKIRQSALDERIKGVEKKEHIIKLLYDEILSLLGGEKKELLFEKGKQNRVMLLGLYGAGKTTTIGKLAFYYAKRGYKTCVVGLDVHRPAASEQLEQIAKKNNLSCFVNKNEKNAMKIWRNFAPFLKEYDLIFVDTAGRDVLDEDLIKEIKEFNQEIRPTHKILIMPADIGQAAKRQASEFQKAVEITGVIITRMDSSAKGGGALTACAETRAHVFFITTGEKINDLESFDPSAFISRLLGMGDLQSLIEKVQSVVDEKKQKEIEKRLEEGKLTLLDVYEQIKAMEGMGSLSSITKLIPGLGGAKIPDELLGKQEGKMKAWKHAIDSMTPEEIENPEILEKETSRIQRVSKGSGVPTGDIRALLKQHKLIKDFMKGGFDPSAGISEKQMQKLAKKFGKRIRL